MIDVADLPPAVRTAVAGLDPAWSNTAGAAHLRHLVACSHYAIGAIWHTNQWHQAIEQSALLQGYLVAAMRLEETTT